MHAAAAEQDGRLSVTCRADTAESPRAKTARRRIRITCGAPKMICFPPSPTGQLSWCRLTERKKPAASRAAAMSLGIGNRRAPNALSPKPAHQEIDRRDDFDAVNVGRMASPANDDDLLVTAGDLLERPKLKWTQLALARRLLVNRLCNLDITKVYQRIEISILGTIRLSIARPNLQVFLIT